MLDKRRLTGIMLGVLAYVSLSIISDSLFARIEAKLLSLRIAFKELITSTEYFSDITYSVDLWSPLLFILIICFGLLFISIKYWARSLALFSLIILLVVIGHLTFLFLDINIYTSKIIAAATIIFFLSNLFDIKPEGFSWREAFLGSNTKQPTIVTPAFDDPKPKKPKKYSPNSESYTKEFKIDNVQSASKDQILDEFFSHNPNEEDTKPEQKTQNTPSPTNEKEIQAKLQKQFFLDHERKLEDLLIDLQDHTLKDLMNVQERLNNRSIKNIDTEDLKSQNFMFLVKEDINKIIDELDIFTFNLAPFMQEDQQGLLDPINIYVDKINYLQKGKLKVKLQSSIKFISMNNNIKINVYRSLCELIKHVKDINQDVTEKPFKIMVIIEVTENNDLSFSINSTHKALDYEKHSFKLKEVRKRLTCIGSKLILGDNPSLSKTKNINKAEFIIKAGNFELKEE